MLSLNYCRSVLNKGERKYDDQEIKSIRDFLYIVAGIEMENNETNEKEDECDYLLPS